MYREIINHLRCPICRKDLLLRSDAEIDGDVLEGMLTCKDGHSFLIHQGVADFNSLEQGFANQWESLGKDQGF